MKLRLLLIIGFIYTTSLFAQNTTITFENHTITEYHAGGVNYKDLDGDGDLDLLSTDGNKVVWFENLDGQGHFSNFHIINNYGHFQIEAIDLDSDGDLDVFTAGGNTQNHPTKWYENNGQGEFTGHTLSSTPLNSYGIRDLDGDGDLDIFGALDFNNGIAWFENNGQGNFGLAQTVDAASAKEISSVDVDVDGDLDIIAGSENPNYIFWYENVNGQGSFGTKQIIDNFVNDNSLDHFSLYDLDLDGDMDVVWKSSYNVYWVENLGQGNFTTKQQIAYIDFWQHFSMVDIDDDGDVDILTTNSSSPSTVADSVGWFENQGQGNFGSYQPLINVSDRVSTVFTLEIDGDGDLDILTVERLTPTSGKSINWYENLGQSNFGSRQYIDNRLWLGVFNMGDIDNDGDGDLLFNGGNIDVSYENVNGQGNFGEMQLVKVELQNPTASMGDLDGDGDLDILSSPSSWGMLVWFENLNGGFFVPKRIIASNMSSTQKGTIAINDMDGDGDMDALAVIQDSSNNDKIIWYENNGQGNFGNTQHLVGISTDQILAIYFSDLDGDGDLDLLSASKNDKIFWYKNNGQGSFGSEIIVTSNANANQVVSIYTSDLDGDGDQDLLSASKSDAASDDITAWYSNDGQGNFGAEQVVTILTPDPTSPLPSDPIATAAKDLDGDGDMDVVSTMANKIVWNENTNGQGSFGSSQLINPNNIDPVNDMYITDIDNDSDMDVISAKGEIVWYKNDGQGNFGTEQVIDGLGSNSVFAGDINGDGNTDVFSVVNSGFVKKLVWFENLGVLGNQVNGYVRFDTSANGCDNMDAPVPNIMVTTDNGANTFSTFTLPDGSYQINTNPGNFTTTINSTFPSYFSVSPNSYSSSFTGLGNTDTGDFCVTSTNSINDVNIAIYPLTDARPGFDAGYQLVYRNIGSTVLNGTVELIYDASKLTFLNASETVSSQTNNTLTVNYSNLNPFETRSIDLHFNVAPPPTTNINDVLSFTAVVNPVTGDNTQADNTFLFDQIVIGSYDPNDIRVVEGDEIYLSEADEYLHYIIRFQNTGTASAVNIRVANILDPKLDWATFQPENMSHPGRVEIKDGNQIEFIFDDIYLPDSNSNEPGSHGFIQYKIKPQSNVAINDIILNTANIFFDFNPPITTNTVTTTIVQNFSIAEHSTNQVVVYPVPSSSILNIKASVPITKVQLFNHLGQRLMNVQKEEGVQNIDIEKIPQGIYFVKLENMQGGVFVKKVVKN